MKQMNKEWLSSASSSLTVQYKQYDLNLRLQSLISGSTSCLREQNRVLGTTTLLLSDYVHVAREKMTSTLNHYFSYACKKILSDETKVISMQDE